MQFYNLRHPEERVSYKKATLLGQGKDNGLFFPKSIPKFSVKFLSQLSHLPNVEIGFECMKDFIGEEIPEEILRNICEETLCFPFPLVEISPEISALEMFHGPSLAFKDVGARFMSRCLSYFLKEEDKKIWVLVATSGDTGGAVASGFYGISDIEVIILYPKNRVSPVQEKQLTGLRGNVKALEVKGSFDDCQRLVKEAFSDTELNEKMSLTSANSINISRWLPQQVYYLIAQKEWQKKHKAKPVISVPSGNFGNLCAGMLAYRRGMPVDHFIAACNKNDVVPKYLKTEKYSTIKALPTLSNAMDVGNPSNFVRVMELFGYSFKDLSAILSGESITDAETLAVIEKIKTASGYTLDPHGAVAYLALENYLSLHLGKKGFFLETAHPVKFPDAVERATNKKIPLPETLKPLMKKEKITVEISSNYSDFRAFLSQLF
ncbi:MAG: threonine synthase [Bergeyella sp.]|nr:threonine synthase [Bergeyella sp.]